MTPLRLLVLLCLPLFFVNCEDVSENDSPQSSGLYLFECMESIRVEIDDQTVLEEKKLIATYSLTYENYQGPRETRIYNYCEADFFKVTIFEDGSLVEEKNYNRSDYESFHLNQFILNDNLMENRTYPNYISLEITDCSQNEIVKLDRFPVELNASGRQTGHPDPHPKTCTFSGSYIVPSTSN